MAGENGVLKLRGQNWSLVNVQRVRSEEPFEICRDGLPGPYDDHVVIVTEEGVEERLCLNRAEAFLTSKGFWLLSKNWDDITARFANVEKKNEVSTQLEALEADTTDEDKSRVANWLHKNKALLTVEELERFRRALIKINFIALQSYTKSDEARIDDILKWFDENRQYLTTDDLSKLEQLKKDIDFYRNDEPYQDAIARLSDTSVSDDDKIFSWNYMRDHQWDKIPAKYIPLLWRAMIDHEFALLDDQTNRVEEREGAILWFNDNWDSLTEEDRLRLKDELSVAVETGEALTAGAAAYVMIGKMEHPLLQEKLAGYISELFDRLLFDFSDRSQGRILSIISALSSAELKLEPALQLSLEGLLSDSIGGERSRQTVDRAVRLGAMNLITALGSSREDALKSVVEENVDWKVFKLALEKLFAMDRKRAVAIARELYLKDDDRDETEGRHDRRENIIKVMTGIYMRYEYSWDDARIDIANLLIDALNSGNGVGYFPSQISRVLAVYPHSSIKDRMNQALAENQKRHDEYVEKQKTDRGVDYSMVIDQSYKVVEDLKRGLRKL